MSRRQLKDLAIRALWTFLQAFTASMAVFAPGIFSAPNLANAKALALSALVASIGAALSAVKTFIKHTVQNRTATF